MRMIGGKDIRAIVADPKWQRLRQGFVGTWRTRSAENVAALEAYLDEEEWDKYAVIRVLNYLTGTAFRIGSIDSPAITALRDRVRAAHAEHKE